ncbi:hypothetical protein CO009_02065 [Candidatus Shapirobacteria bacterium CG_4_8_14_3_um_filter_35_11]|uniref:PIN domain-containing protein n=5 Tax=Candidatus Shapironibacteriota TaxID=1752721 RepID=A0A1J5I3T8_9BACT|nr:MAG: hypothetical protein AUK05_00305 [Candidatus Shapirobacteria bacterium CG2_30_35_20]PIV07547.1 MAG: hypothetical protein COS53_01870 [Candidatus Shapirobacteria bacterium CG03_land_8_20_14_0_80_35_14]PJA50809.1 MAG: hypothetical protein CO168_03130 [Candidatus Shapirobacteria bacterium CG_4_9_14_3_um_filter_36_12]PJC80375.1 MAG: hypothetical protein CO009_02065 [Candidatus Shapirobacteria bacterium CG_4_8_14_3_um_filter_35_11]PJE67008.1 MAG: hypothetical protein COU93_01150 [Candidatus 
MDKVFWDTSGIKALRDEKDEFHQIAVSVWSKLNNKNVEIYVSNYIIDESYTLLRLRCGMGTVKLFRDYLVDMIGTIKVERVKSRDEIDAWKWFEKDWSKLSFTDCVSFALMKRLGIKRVFGFDKHFEKAGFVLEK